MYFQQKYIIALDGQQLYACSSVYSEKISLKWNLMLIDTKPPKIIKKQRPSQIK